MVSSARPIDSCAGGPSGAVCSGVRQTGGMWGDRKAAMFFRLVYDDSLAQAAYLIGRQRTDLGEP